MARQSQVASSLLVMTICTATLFQITVAQLPLHPSFPGGSRLPLPPILPGGDAGDVLKCWASLLNVPDCVQEIMGSLFSGQLGKIGPNCCNAINGITKDCWPKMFPAIPLFPPWLKDICAASAQSAAAAPIEEPEAP